MRHSHAVLRSACAGLLVLAAELAAPSKASAQSVATTRYASRPLTSAEAIADLTLMRQALEEIHAGYDRYTPRRLLDSAFARAERRLAAGPTTDVAFYGEVARLLARIRCNHTKAELPVPFEQYRRRAASHFPVRVVVVEGRVLVDRGGASGLVRGTELLAINGRTAKLVLDSIGRFASIDGYTDHTRATLFGDDDDLMGADLDHYWPIAFGEVDRWTLRVRAPGGTPRTVTLAPVTFADWRRLTNDTTMLDFGNGTDWRLLDDTTALLTIRSFVNYRRPVNADSVLASAFATMRTRGARHLVVDLRENGGGSDDVADALLRHLISRPVQARRAIRRRVLRITTPQRHFETWGDASAIFAANESLLVRQADGWYAERGAVDTVTPAPQAFAGRVSVLIGPRNGSGATMLLAVLQQEGRATGRLRLVGSATGGSAEGVTGGQILFLALPNSRIKVRIPLKRSDVNVNSFIPGFGVFPGIDATPTVTDVVSGRDAAVQIAQRAPWTRGAQLLGAWVGMWSGSLEYLDYTSGKRTTIPSWLHVAPIGQSNALRVWTVYDDGPGNFLSDVDVVDATRTRWREGSATSSVPLRVRVQPTARADSLALELRGPGMDDRKPVEFRYTVDLTPDRFRRLKEFRSRAEQPWSYRHEYRYRRMVP